VPIRMTDAERSDCEAAAEAAGQKLSDWIRQKAVNAAKRTTK